MTRSVRQRRNHEGSILFQKMSHHLMAHLFSFVEDRLSILRWMRVCRAFRDGIRQMTSMELQLVCPRWTNTYGMSQWCKERITGAFTKWPRKEDEPSITQVVQTFPSLRILRLYDVEQCDVTRMEQSNLLANLVHLELDMDIEAPDLDFSKIAPCPLLEELEIRCTTPNIPSIKNSFPRLKRFELTSSHGYPLEARIGVDAILPFLDLSDLTVLRPLLEVTGEGHIQSISLGDVHFSAHVTIAKTTLVVDTLILWHHMDWGRSAGIEADEIVLHDASLVFVSRPPKTEVRVRVIVDFMSTALSPALVLPIARATPQDLLEWQATHLTVEAPSRRGLRSPTRLPFEVHRRPEDGRVVHRIPSIVRKEAGDF